MTVPFLIKHQDEKQAEEVIETFSRETITELQTTEETKEQTTEAKEEDFPDNAVGIIEIPKLGIRYPVYEGTSDAVLNMGIGHIPESAGLLAKGNCVLAGHNGSRQGEFFTKLSSVSIGDEVMITNSEKVTHTYRIEDTGIVGPFDLSITEPKEEETLTLFTCAYHGTQRFFCRCYIKKD